MSESKRREDSTTYTANTTNDSTERTRRLAGLWEDYNTGDWVADNRSGRQKADDLVKSLRGPLSPAVLGHMVKAMLEIDHYGGVECGFFHRIAEYLAQS
jgi:hypothetical protein